MKATMGAVLAAALLSGSSPTFPISSHYSMPTYRLANALKPKAKRNRKNTGSGVAKAKRLARKAKNH